MPKHIQAKEQTKAQAAVAELDEQARVAEAAAKEHLAACQERQQRARQARKGLSHDHHPVDLDDDWHFVPPLGFAGSDPTMDAAATARLVPGDPGASPFARRSLGDAQLCADLFQRSSSCVEGRNGQLSLKHHALHRFTLRKLQALKVMHNYLARRPDGTKAAERFYGAPSRDLFAWLLDHIAIPSRPRSRRRAA